jgi:hypothetical protein
MKSRRIPGRNGSAGSRVAALVIAAMLLGAVASPARSQAQLPTRSWEAEFDEDKKPWKEIEATLPAYPKPETLVRFQVGPPGGHGYFVDAPSLSIGEDGVVRYTLVIRTTGGATNVTYEGVRCEERHQKTYAIGQAKGTWVRARDSQWRRIEYRSINNYHSVLYADFLCDGKYTAKSVKDVLQRLRQPPSRPTTGD